MKKRDIQFCIESLSFFMGVGRITDEVASRIARMDKVLWEELEAVLIPKQEPVVEEAPEPEEPPAEAASDPDPEEHQSEEEPEPEVEPLHEVDPGAELDASQNEPEKVEDVLVCKRPECKKCRYSSGKGSDMMCDYMGRTGLVRGGLVKDCEHYKDKPPRVFAHRCKQCGRAFSDGASRTVLCPECREAVRKR